MKFGKKRNAQHLIYSGIMSFIFIFVVFVISTEASLPPAPTVPYPTVPAGATEVKGLSVEMCSSDPTTFTVGGSATLSYNLSATLNFAADCTKNYAGSVVTPAPGTTTYYVQCSKPDGVGKGGKYNYTACVDVTAEKILTGTCGCAANKFYNSQPPNALLCATGSPASISVVPPACDGKGNCTTGGWSWLCGYNDATHYGSWCQGYQQGFPNDQGSCGAANGGTYVNAAAVSAAQLCKSGTASAVSLAGNTFSWSCTGKFGCWNDSCSATKLCVPDNSGASSVCVGSNYINNCGQAIPGTKCCDTSWLPDPTTVCAGQSFTQTSNCGNTRTFTGTKPQVWNPPFNAATQCTWISLVQNDGCGNTQTVNGTKTINECCPVKACGTANNVPTTVKPASNLCADGATPTVTDTGTSWTWTCPNACQGAILQNCTAPHTIDFQLKNWRETPQ